MIVDTLSFYNEVDVLEFRLENYYDIVDKFIIVEGTHTYQGDEKPLMFQETLYNSERFKKYKDKIITHTFKSKSKEEQPDPWDNEKNQRRDITKVCSDMGLTSDDIIIVGDCDEIYDKECLKQIFESQLPSAGYVWLSSYYLNVWRTFPWSGAYVMNFDPNFDLDDTRHNREPPHINFPFGSQRIGWHFSWIGDIEWISTKIKSYAHNEYNDFASEEHLKNHVKNLEWIFPDEPEDRRYFQVDDNPVPIFFKKDKFKHLFWSEK